MIDFATPPDIGTVLSLDAQDYELARVEPYTRRDGTASVLLTWETTCPTCGTGFEVASGLVSKSLVRRCVAHRKSGKPVKGKRSRRVKVSVVEA